MSKGMKIFLIIVAILISIILLGIIGLFLIYHFYVSPMITEKTKIPEEFKKAAVLQGQGLVDKTIYFQDPELGNVTDIQMSDLDVHPGMEIGIVGESGAVLLDTQLQPISKVHFNDKANRVKIISLPNDPSCQYISRGSWGSPGQLMDHEGKLLWSSPDKSGVDDTDAGDINGDGKLEMVVGYNGGGGISLFDSTGKLLWNKFDGNVWRVSMIDMNHDGKLEIVHSNAAGNLCIRDAQGNILHSYNPKPYFSFFSLTHWPDLQSPQYPIYSGNDNVMVIDYEAKFLKAFSAPNTGAAYHISGTPIKLNENQPPYFAVLFDFSNARTSALYLYDSAGNLAYREVFDDLKDTIYALHNDSTNTDTLLIGGNGKVWQYSLKKQ